MSNDRQQGLLKAINDLKTKDLSPSEIKEILEKVAEIGDKNLSDDLIPLIDKFENDKEIIFLLKETLSKLQITPYNLNEEGIAEEDADNVDGAIHKYELCVKLDPSYHWAWYNLGRMLDRKHLTEQAIDMYKKALEVNENYGDAWNNLGNIYSKINRFSLAREAYERSANCPAYDSKHFPYFNLGLLYDKVDDHGKAIEYYSKAIELRNDYAKAHYNIGRSYKKLGGAENIEKAKEFFSESIKLDSSLINEIRDQGVIIEELMALEILKKLEKFEVS
ncbi:MAG: tetratricopeptide repeat protein [Candidatus Lokiarchaeota archaeon]|nr:tetratricopeptide repeat protein [Candidatus Lokiarchaeota archaeon]